MKHGIPVALVLALGSSTAAVQAQVLGGGGTTTASVSQRFEVDDNYRLTPDSPGTSFFSDTRLGLDYVKETTTQRFYIGGNVGVRLLWEADRDFDVTYANPAVARTSYRHEWADSEFDGYLRYSYRQMDGSYTLAPDGTTPIDLPPQNLDRFDGNENRWDGGFTLSLLEDAPSSYRFRLRGTTVDYSNVRDDETIAAVPREQLFGDILWSLRVNPVLSTGVVASYDYYRADNETDNEIRTAAVDAGLIYDADENLNFTAGIGYEHRQRWDTISGDRDTTEDDSGIALRGSVDYLVDDFTLNANARYTTAAPDPRWTGNFQLDYALPRGRLFATGYRDYTGNTRGDEVLAYGIGLGVEREINTISRWDVLLASRNEIDDEDPAVDDIDRVDLAARYVRDLTPDVSAALGYRLRLRTEGEDAYSNALFFTIGRTWARRP